MTSIARFARPLDRLAVRIDPLAVSKGDAKLLREGAEFFFLLAELLLAIEELHRFLLEEPEVLQDFGLHRVGLDTEPFRIAPRGARTPEVIVDTVSREFRFMAGLLEIPEPLREQRVAGREVGLARDQLGLERGGLLGPGPQVPILLPEVFHEVVRSLQFRLDGPLLRRHFLELRLEVLRLPLEAFLAGRELLGKVSQSRGFLVQGPLPRP